MMMRSTIMPIVFHPSLEGQWNGQLSVNSVFIKEVITFYTRSNMVFKCGGPVYPK